MRIVCLQAVTTVSENTFLHKLYFGIVVIVVKTVHIIASLDNPLPYSVHVIRLVGVIVIT